MYLYTCMYIYRARLWLKKHETYARKCQNYATYTHIRLDPNNMKHIHTYVES